LNLVGSKTLSGEKAASTFDLQSLKLFSVKSLFYWISFIWLKLYSRNENEKEDLWTYVENGKKTIRGEESKPVEGERSTGHEYKLR
jgi:hypothetical protein